MKLWFFLKQIPSDAIKVATSKEGIRGIWNLPLYRNSIYLMTNTAILSLTGFFFWAIAARIYPVEGVGLASAAISSMTLLALLSTIGLDYGLVRFLPNSGRRATSIINSCSTVGGLISIALSLIFLAGLNIWSPALLLLREHPVFLAAFVVFTAAVALRTFFSQAFVAKRRAGLTLAEGLIFSLIRFIPLILLASSYRTFGIFASWGIALGIGVAISIILFLPRIQAGYRPLPIIDRQVINDLMHFSFANYAASLFGAVPGFVFPLMVVNFLGAESNAYFYVAWVIGGILFMIPRAASLSLFAEGSHDEQRLGQATRRSLKLIVVVLIPAIVIIAFLGSRILLLFGVTYSENATKLLWILASCALPASISYVYFSVKRVQRKMKAPVALSALTMASSLPLSYFLLSRLGIIGVGIAWLISQMVVALLISFEFWKILKHSK